MNQNNIDESSNPASANLPTMPPDFMPRNKNYAIILFPLGFIIFVLTAISIFHILFPPTRIFDEIPPAMRIFQQLLFILAAVAGIILAVTAWMSSLNVRKFYNVGNQKAAVAASEKADKNGKFLPLFAGMFVLLILVKMATMFLLK